MPETTVKPQKLAGFRDFFADDIQIREYVMGVFKNIFEKYGYEPLETPALEYADIFSCELGEEAEKLFYKFKDQGDRDIMLKYEVMISMCRAVAENINTITFPYKRYQIQKVWRCEKPQKGRFREFTQCDADTIGSPSMLCDAEFIQMGIEALQTLGFSNFRAAISNRKFLNGIIQYAGANEEEFIPICLSVDKLPKIGKDAVKKELLEKRNISSTVADKILAIVTQSGDTKTLLDTFKKQLVDVPVAREGLSELEQIFDYLTAVGVDPRCYIFAPYIARGLAYYTGPVWEFEVLEGGVGSIAGCGRYDNTIGRFLGRPIAATGGSFGIERIIEIIKDKKMAAFSPTKTKVLVTVFDKNTLPNSIVVANQLRKSGIPTFLYPECEKLDKQLKFADKKGIPYAIVIGPDEVAAEKIALKDMAAKKQTVTTLDEVIKTLSR